MSPAGCPPGRSFLRADFIIDTPSSHSNNARRIGTSASDGRVQVDCIDATGQVPAGDLNWLTEKLAAGGDELRVGGEVRVRVVGDAEMQALHARYCNDPTTTDVLTFDLAEGAAAAQAAAGGVAELNVDIVVCLDEAKRQAAARGHEARRELLLYGVHGMLHCLGYDDHDDQAFAAMHEREDAVLRAIGIGATFAVLPRQQGDES